LIVAYFEAVSRIISERIEDYYEVNLKAAIRVLKLRFNIAPTYDYLKIRQRKLTLGKKKNSWKDRAKLMFNGLDTRQSNVGGAPNTDS
jgi:hypothetical protein